MAGAFTEKESRLVKAALESVQGGDAALMKLVRTVSTIRSISKSQSTHFSEAPSCAFIDLLSQVLILLGFVVPRYTDFKADQFRGGLRTM